MLMPRPDQQELAPLTLIGEMCGKVWPTSAHKMAPLERVKGRLSVSCHCSQHLHQSWEVMSHTCSAHANCKHFTDSECESPTQNHTRLLTQGSWAAKLASLHSTEKMDGCMLTIVKSVRVLYHQAGGAKLAFYWLLLAVTRMTELG